MGDHRVSIKATFQMHGIEDAWDCWLNWSDDLPEQFAEWIRRNQRKAMAKYNEATFTVEERNAKLTRDRELAELARLKAKYETR